MARNISLKCLHKETPITIPLKQEIQLTADEDHLCTLLDECKRDLASKGQHVECRFAGGWVRDKLLGAQSNDIDVALANIMGVSFAEKFVEYVASKDLPVKTVATIARNPDQSKHLETAKTTVLGIELDLVNLRSESYTEDSRIPTEMKLGTPLEDALRRDITINALFYNVHSREVEDYTQKGLDDLKNGVLRTPLAPFETFKDDPLRVVRCIRFASRFGFKMVPEIETAVQDKEIQAAIVSKISRERIGEELDKMMKGRDPLHSIRLITSLNLHSSIFSVPPSFSRLFSQNPGPSEAALGAATILYTLMTPELSNSIGFPIPHPLLLSQFDSDKTLRPRLFLATALTPYAQVKYCNPKKSSVSPAVEIVIREGLKLGLQNHYTDGIPALFSAAEILRGIDVSNFKGPDERGRIGLLLRTKSIHNSISGSHWTSSLLFSLVQELVSLWDIQSDNLDQKMAMETIKRYNKFVERVEELNLPMAIDDKPLLNGKEVVSLLGAKPGPWTGTALALVSEWALNHPEGTKDDCSSWLKEQYEAGKIDIGGGTDKAPPAKKAKVAIK